MSWHQTRHCCCAIPNEIVRRRLVFVHDAKQQDRRGGMAQRESKALSPRRIKAIVVDGFGATLFLVSAVAIDVDLFGSDMRQARAVVIARVAGSLAHKDQ